MIEHLTEIIERCLTNAPNPTAGARLAAYRVTDELRKATTDNRVVEIATDEVGYIILSDQHYADIQRAIAAAWDVVLEDGVER